MGYTPAMIDPIIRLQLILRGNPRRPGIVLGSVLLIAVVIGVLGIRRYRCSRPLVIAYAGTLTGKNSELGIQGRNGVVLAVEEINAAGGINGTPIALRNADDRNDAAAARARDAEFAAQGVPVIVGHMTSDMSRYGLEGLAGSETIMVSPTATSTEFTGIDDQFLRVCPVNVVMADPVREYIQAKGYRRAFGIYDSNNRSYAHDYMKNFRNRITPGSPLTLTDYEFSAGRYVEAVRAFRASGADVVVLALSAYDAAMLVQQLRRSGYRGLVAAAGWAMTDDLIRHGGRSVEGMILSHFINMGKLSAPMSTIAEQYRNRFGSEPSFAAFYGYDTVFMLAQALRSGSCIGRMSGAEIKRAIIRKGTFISPMGDYRIDSNGDSGRAAWLYQVRNGAFELVE